MSTGSSSVKNRWKYIPVIKPLQLSTGILFCILAYLNNTMNIVGSKNSDSEIWKENHIRNLTIAFFHPNLIPWSDFIFNK